ncbi:MAG: hypothetical protein GX653_03305 [Clostridiales bacterium]|nr:hypothetical protein [Clostridiales bacterium]
MKKIYWLFVCAALLAACLLPVLAQEEPFVIEGSRLYDRMTRPYDQGYQPLVEGRTAHIVVPLLSDASVGDITATLVPADAAAFPASLDQPLSQVVARREEAVDGDKLSLYRVHFRLALYRDRMKGDYPFQVVVEGQDAAGKPLRQTFDGVLVVVDGQPNPEVPALALTDVAAESDLLVGEEGLLRLTVRNPSASQRLRGVKLRLVDDKGEILPRESDTLYVGELLPGEERALALPLRVVSTAAALPHAVALSWELGYGDAKAATGAERFTLAVHQEARLRYGEPVLPSSVMQGDIATFSMNVMNMGRGALHNVLLTFDLPGLSGGGSVLVGKVDPGESKQATANLRAAADALGAVEGRVQITYEDAYGKGYSQEVPLSISVEKKKVAVFEVPDANKKQDSMQLREIIAWSAGGALLLALLVQSILLRRRIRTLEEKGM